MSNYRSIQQEVVDEFIERKSRFITYLFPIRTQDEFDERLAEIRKEHYRATHHCQAYILEEDASIQRANDDGEPGGTAGMPMLEVLKHHELTYIGAVVVRYFGGIKLGAGGLIRAYGQGVADALKIAPLIENIDQQIVELVIDYTNNDPFTYWLEQTDFAVTILDTQYSDVVTYTLAMPVPQVEPIHDELINRFSANLTWTAKDIRQVDLPLTTND